MKVDIGVNLQINIQVQNLVVFQPTLARWATDRSSKKNSWPHHVCQRKCPWVNSITAAVSWESKVPKVLGLEWRGITDIAS